MIRLRAWLEEIWKAEWWRTPAVLSGAAHVVVIAALLHTWWFWAKPMQPAGTAQGSQRMLLALPGRTMAAKAAVTKAAVKARPRMAPSSAAAVTYMAPDADLKGEAAHVAEEAQGNDALGTGSVNIAWIQAFPASKPDFSQVTSGSSNDVVVDILIDDTGKVASARTKQGMGRAIDDVVIATVEQWVFYPATRNGRPVSSEQELHFHYARGSGSDPCGWNCFALAGH